MLFTRTELITIGVFIDTDGNPNISPEQKYRNNLFISLLSTAFEYQYSPAIISNQSDDVIFDNFSSTCDLLGKFSYECNIGKKFFLI